MREEIFQTEILYLKKARYQDIARKLLGILPDYFFEIAASSTGKYHPPYALGDGGLVRHTKAAMKFGKVLLDNPSIGEKYTEDEKDLMLLALLVHDGFKLGLEKDKYTVFDHPLVVSKEIQKHKDALGLEAKELELLTSAIETHMGPWTKDYEGNEVLQPPKTKYQRFVHMCDFLASQKWLPINFEGNELAC